jgi:hypothetical protein
MTDRYRQAAERLADAAGELLFESNNGLVTGDTMAGLAMALRNYRLVAKEARND